MIFINLLAFMMFNLNLITSTETVKLKNKKYSHILTEKIQKRIEEYAIVLRDTTDSYLSNCHLESTDDFYKSILHYYGDSILKKIYFIECFSLMNISSINKYFNLDVEIALRREFKVFIDLLNTSYLDKSHECIINRVFEIFTEVILEHVSKLSDYAYIYNIRLLKITNVLVNSMDCSSEQKFKSQKYILLDGIAHYNRIILHSESFLTCLKVIKTNMIDFINIIMADVNMQPNYFDYKQFIAEIFSNAFITKKDSKEKVKLLKKNVLCCLNQSPDDPDGYKYYLEPRLVKTKYEFFVQYLKIQQLVQSRLNKISN